MVHARTERIGSWDINAALIDHVRRHRGLVIGEQTAERLKRELASATLPDDLAQQITIKGRDVLSSSPGQSKSQPGKSIPSLTKSFAKQSTSYLQPSPSFLPK